MSTQLCFSCFRQQLIDAINSCSRAISPKTNIPALSGILLQANGDRLNLTAYDLEFAIKTGIDIVSSADGSVIIPFKIFSDILRRMSGDRVEIKIDEKNIASLKCGDTETDVSCIKADEYPELPQIVEDNSLSLKGDVFKNMIRQTIFCVSQTEIRPVNMGVFFQMENKQLKMVALDGFRLALKKCEIDNPDTYEFIVPGKSLSEVSRLIPDSDEEIKICVGRRHSIFTAGNYTLITRLIEGEFFDYNKIISPDYSTRVVVNVRTLLNSVELASLIVDERVRTPLPCLFENNSCVIKFATSIGKISDIVPCSVEGERIRIGVNNRYLIDALSNSEVDEVAIEMNDPLRPIKIKPAQGDDFLFIILPIKMEENW
ncbi:MAG: DNA polymerase III subunit beta [Clostridia bacterium]|nr:DNA polymerase III subunit beta [Clostridia bacterium]